MDAPYASERERLDRLFDPQVDVTRLASGRHQFTLRIEDRVASELTVLEHDQLFGRAKLRMAGVASVHTAPAFRKRGCARRLINHALAWMRCEGYDISLLFGIEGLYPKFGYAPVLPASSLHLAVRDAERLPEPGLTMAPFEPRHLAAVLRLYRGEYQGRVGPLRRDARRWTPFRKGLAWHTRAIVELAVDGRGRVRGYWARNDAPRDVTALEVACADQNALHAVLRSAARCAVSQRLEQLRFMLPTDHPLAQLVRVLGGVQRIEHRSDGHAMARLIHVGSTLRALAPCLGPHVDRAGQMTLATNLDTVVLSFKPGEVTVHDDGRRVRPLVRLPQWALAQLAYGQADVFTLAALGWIRGPRPGLRDLAMMFPPTPSHFPAVDEF